MAKTARIAFHIYLTLTLFGMAVGVLYFLLMRNDFLTQNPDIEPFFKAYVGTAIVILAGTLALLNARRWGFWVMLAGFAGAFVIELYSGFAWERMIRIPIAALILFLLTRWNKMI